MRILIFGDSHSRCFNIHQDLLNGNPSFEGVKIRVVPMPGATIAGFGKRKSTLNTREAFLNEIAEFDPNYVCFALGQVDIELGLYYKQVVKGEDIKVSAFIDELCSSYMSSIDDIITQCNLLPHQLCVKGINIPVLTKCRTKAIQYTKRIIVENVQDEEAIKRYSKKLWDVFPSCLERYVIHNMFNEQLQKALKGRYKYFDLNEEIKDKELTGHVAKVFIPAQFDHHLVDSHYLRELHVNKLINTLLNI